MPGSTALMKKTLPVKQRFLVATHLKYHLIKGIFMILSKRKLKLVISCLVLLFFISTVNSQVQPLPRQDDRNFLLGPPSFSPEIFIRANNVDLKVDTYASVPCVADWNGDGNKDLLVGCFYYGTVYVYLNSGTNAAPIFTTGSKLSANGVEISVAYG
jgi:hypothetical protein